MPHDKNNNTINVGDTILLRAKVESLADTSTGCNLTIRPEEPFPSDPPHHQHIGYINSKQVSVIEIEEPGGLMACSPTIMDAVVKYAPYTKENVQLLYRILNYTDKSNTGPLFDLIDKYNENEQKIQDILSRAFMGQPATPPPFEEGE